MWSRFDFSAYLECRPAGRVCYPLSLDMSVEKQSSAAEVPAGDFQNVAQAATEALAHERDRLRLLLDVNNAIVSTLDMPDVFAAISAFCRDVVHHEYTSLALLEKDSNSIRLFALDFPGGVSNSIHAYRWLAIWPYP